MKALPTDTRAPKKKERKKPARARGMMPRVLRMEICGVESTERADPASDTSLVAVLESIRSMGFCLAKAMEVAFSLLNRQDVFWALRLPPEIQARLAIVTEKVKYTTDDGKECLKDVTRFSGDTVSSWEAVYHTIKYMCPCLPSTVLTTTSKYLLSAYSVWREAVLLQNKPDGPRRLNFKPPYPFSIKSGEFRIDKCGKRHMTIRIPVRTGRLCPYAQENPKVRCLYHPPKPRKNESDEDPKPLIPFRGFIPANRKPDSERTEPAAYVTLRCFVAGRKDRKAYLAFEKILSGKWQVQNLVLALQGTKDRKQCWMANLSFEEPMPAKREGVSAAAVFSFSHLIYSTTQDGRTYHRASGEGMRRQNKQFRAMAKRYDAQNMRLKENEVPPGMQVDLVDLVKGAQTHYRDLGDDLRLASYSSRPGACKRGKKLRYRDVHALQGKQKRVVSWVLHQAATDYIRWLVRAGVSDLYLLKWNLKASDLPKDMQQRVVEFPRYQLAQIIRQRCDEEGIKVHNADGESAEEGNGNGKTKKAKKTQKPQLDCPCCGFPIEWKPGVLCTCRKKLEDGLSCLFGAYFDEWRALQVLLNNKVDITKAMEGLMTRRQCRRVDRDKEEGTKMISTSKEMNNAL